MTALNKLANKYNIQTNNNILNNPSNGAERSFFLKEMVLMFVP
jgi:hypothetical protein